MISNVMLLNDILAIETFTSWFAVLPSEISTNLNNLYTVLPRSSETINGVDGVWYCSKYQAIDELVPLSSLADGNEIKEAFKPLM